MTGPVTSSSLSSLTWKIDDLEGNCQDIYFIVDCYDRVILILTKFGILISTWFQIVPFGL